MHIEHVTPASPPPVPRAYAVSMVITSFKGRKNVEAHLFRPDTPAAEGAHYPWEELIGPPPEGLELPPDLPPDLPEACLDPEQTKRTVLEAFTEAEVEQLLAYLKAHYEGRVPKITVTPLPFPVPLGIPPLSCIPEGKTMGFIRFEKIPNFALEFPVHGFYDLAQHEPLVMDI